MTLFLNYAEIQFLKWLVGKQLFCQNCEKILDWQTTCLYELPSKKFIVCDDCFADLISQVFKQHNFYHAEQLISRGEFSSAHNWHVEGNKLVRGYQVLREYNE